MVLSALELRAPDFVFSLGAIAELLREVGLHSAARGTG
jgi:hypothetical protein